MTALEELRSANISAAALKAFLRLRHRKRKKGDEFTTHQQLSEAAKIVWNSPELTMLAEVGKWEMLKERLVEEIGKL